MKLGVLFSGGKDSCYAMFKAMQDNEIKVLITVISENPESYMFHVPNIEITKIQAEAIDLPIIYKVTKGVKEEELDDLKQAIIEAKEKFGIGGIVTGAVESVYQSTRIQKICDELGLTCVNPIWKIDQEQLLRDLLENKFEIIISGFFAYPFDETILGKVIDEKLIDELVELRKKYEISPAGEGGEIETTVLDAPFFKKKIEITDSEVKLDNNSGVFVIKKAELLEK